MGFTIGGLRDRHGVPSKNPKENREEAEAKFKDIAEARKKWMGVSKKKGYPKMDGL